jgi:hypothetical protein
VISQDVARPSGRRGWPSGLRLVRFGCVGARPRVAGLVAGIHLDTMASTRTARLAPTRLLRCPVISSASRHFCCSDFPGRSLTITCGMVRSSFRASLGEVMVVADLLHPLDVLAIELFLHAVCVKAVVGEALCQCFSPVGNHTTSPGSISSMGTPHRCTHPKPEESHEREGEGEKPAKASPRDHVRIVTYRWLTRQARRPSVTIKIAPITMISEPSRRRRMLRSAK